MTIRIKIYFKNQFVNPRSASWRKQIDFPFFRHLTDWGEQG